MGGDDDDDDEDDYDDGMGDADLGLLNSLLYFTRE